MSWHMTPLREDLLHGRAVVLAGDVGGAVREQLSALGARVELFGEQLAGDEDAARDWIADRVPLHALVYDANVAFGDGGLAGLQAAVQFGWVATRAVATEALIAPKRPARHSAEQGGKVVLLAPGPDAGPYAEAARAALENLARTLSVEWARHALTTTMIAPGPESTPEQLATLVCFLVSRAGGYLSGCRLDLGVTQPRSLLHTS